MGHLLAEDTHVVPLYYPIDLDSLAGAESPVICLTKNWRHVSILIGIGVNPLANGVIKVYSCDDTTPTTETAIIFDYYKCETSSILANGDVLGAKATAVAATGIVPTATAVPNFFVIEFDSSALVEGDIGFRLAIADPAAASVGFAFAILSDPRYAEDQNVTAMSVI